ncbi:MAG TPA: S8 family serine peptidase [Actinomycetota bacterium]|nr:S8 family serine peptidase [Actinomycetota bacterium]
MRRGRAFAALMLAVTAAASLAVAPASASSRARIDPAVFLESGRISVLVHLADGVDMGDGVAAATRAGLATGTTYAPIGVFVAYGGHDAVERLARDAAVVLIEANASIEAFTDTSHRATRGENLLAGEVTAPDGTRLDGSGVGVAVVDSGVDGTHPDLVSRMGGNVKIVCSVPMPGATQATPFEECRGPKTAVPMDDTDTPSLGGHGTHVAGIVAGTGAASEGRFHGAAPGATLYGVSVGTMLTVENALDGLAWVLENHDRVTPAIRVVNNSWGSVYQPYDPANGVFHKATWKLQEALVAEGVSVVFAAGNSYGTGYRATTTAECINPTPGVVCVSNYFDQNSGTREGNIDGSSSRGEWDRPETWPDVAAPGTQITSTCRPHLPVCALLDSSGGATENYAVFTGTSMAAPNVAGIVAQVLQANPQLTPAQIENLLEDTAHKFAWGSGYGAFEDATNPDNSSSFEKGHGLVDALAAARVALGIDPAPGASEFPQRSPQLPIHEASGFVAHWNFTSITEQEFRETCLGIPQSQAIDAYVFEIPENLRARPLRVRIGGTNPIPFYDVGATFYDAACAVVGTLARGGDEDGPVPAGTRYIVVTPGILAYATEIFIEYYDATTPVPVPTNLLLAVTGQGSQKTLVATLQDSDGTGVEGRSIGFFADGAAIGSSTTDAAGVARLAVPPQARSAKTSFTAAFAGDAEYAASSAPSP